MRIAGPCLALLPGIALAYGEHPPAGHAGGFGEPDCGACHAAAGATGGDPELAIRGLPDRYEPGATYHLEIELSAPGMAAGGVAVTARSRDGAPAGSWSAGDGLEVARQGGLQYLHQEEPRRGGRAAWTAAWTAPADCRGTVVMHAAGNAANDDDSSLGDRVVTKVVEVAAPARCPE